MKPPTALQRRRMAELLDYLTEAASKGAPCPNNSQILDALDLSGVSEVSPLFDRLEAEGLLVVERTGNRRRATIVATGQSTAWTFFSRGRPRLFVGTNGPGDSARPIDGFRGDLPPERYADRDPCFHCGIPKHRGCRHHPVERMAA